MELDLADMGIDYRDRFKPGGGPSRLTVRRLLLLVDGLDRFTSRFWNEVGGQSPISTTDIVLTDIWQSITGEKRGHPLRRPRESRDELRERENRKRAIRAAVRRRKRLRVAARRE